MEAPSIGIDLGTTYSCVAVYHNEKVHIIPNQEQGSYPTTPSYVFFDTNGDEVVGIPAKSNAYRNLDNTIYDVKRILGREFSNPELQTDIKFWPFTVQQGDEENAIPMVKVNGELLYPEEISAKLLAKLKSFAEKFLQLQPGTIKKAVITVPAYFHDGQRQATIDAGELAGLEVLTILNEPTAAAIAYSMERLNAKAQKILIYDLGGGTFDVAVLNMETLKIDDLAVHGDAYMDAEGIDKELMEFCLSKFKSVNGFDLLQLKDSADSYTKDKTRRSLRRLQTYCKTAKKYLTTECKATVEIDSFFEGEDLVVTITPTQFKEMNAKLDIASEENKISDSPTGNKIEVLGVNGDSHLGGEDFDKKLMEHCLSQFKTETGVDLLQLKTSTDAAVKDKAKRSIRRLQTYCEIAKKDLTSGVRATVWIDGFYGGDDLVVNLRRQQFEEMNKSYFEKTIELVDATLKELGLSKADIDDIVLVGGSTRIPKVQQLLTEYFGGKLLNTSIHPDQAVAYGAAVQAALMTTEKSSPAFNFHKFSDVTPMALGIEDNGTDGLTDPIPRNTKLPVERSTERITMRDGQTAMTFNIYQGNDLLIAANNRLLGSFRLEGIPPKKVGEEVVVATMKVNKMGILHVVAVCQSNLRSKRITIVENKNRMSQETKKRLLEKANTPKTEEGLGLMSRLPEINAHAPEKGPRDHDIE